MRKVVLYQSLTHRSRMDQLSADSKRGPALLPAPVSPDFGSWVPKDTWAWFRRHARSAPARACGLSRRSSRPVCFRSRRSFSFPDLVGPLQYCRGQHSSLAGSFIPNNPEASSRFRRSPFRGFRSGLRLPFRPMFPCCFRSPSASDPSEHPRTGFRWSPEGFRHLPARVSSWLCFGFPRRHRLLTVMKLSLNRVRGKRENGHFAC